MSTHVPKVAQGKQWSSSENRISERAARPPGDRDGGESSGAHQAGRVFAGSTPQFEVIRIGPPRKGHRLARERETAQISSLAVLSG